MLSKWAIVVNRSLPESITAELQGATTQYGVNMNGNAGGTLGPRYENPDGNFVTVATKFVPAV